jgi:hypothetical protein
LGGNKKEHLQFGSPLGKQVLALGLKLENLYIIPELLHTVLKAVSIFRTIAKAISSIGRAFHDREVRLDWKILH